MKTKVKKLKTLTAFEEFQVLFSPTKGRRIFGNNPDGVAPKGRVPVQIGERRTTLHEDTLVVVERPTGWMATTRS